MKYRIKKAVTVAMGVLVSTCILVESAAAIFYCESATITKAGSTDPITTTVDGEEVTSSPYKIKITCPNKWNGNERGFYLTTTVGDAGMAAALTALAAKKYVRIEAIDDEWNSLMTAIEVRQEDIL